MATADTIAVSVSEEAAARIAELGLGREFDEIVEYLKQSQPGLWKLDVELSFDPEEPVPPTVLLDAFRPFLGLEEEAALHDRWTRWIIKNYPPEVFLHFIMLPTFEECHGR